MAVKLFRKLGAKVVPLYCEPDGTFPNHLPDPSKQENLVDLQKKVLAERADLGIAYDGDGDRAVFVDEKGKIISSDAANVLFIREVLESLPRGETVGFELRCSMAVAEEIASLGGIPFETRAGRIAVRETIREGAVFACETTGHVCFAENNGFDDGLFASAKLAWLVKSKAAAASKLAASVKTYFSTRELRIPCEIKDEAVETVKKSLSSQNLKLSTADGVKYADASAWGLVRASQTEPLLSARFEGKTQKDLQSVYDLFARAFPASIKLPSLESIMQN
ncbi:TPA: hypothetical protein HA244_02695 [Candidatus Micrarchaeota archaeon]|nr:hypothetical protein [Candidatus Micrarchaeota archaeon]